MQRKNQLGCLYWILVLGLCFVHLPSGMGFAVIMLALMIWKGADDAA